MNDIEYVKALLDQDIDPTGLLRCSGIEYVTGQMEEETAQGYDWLTVFHVHGRSFIGVTAEIATQFGAEHQPNYRVARAQPLCSASVVWKTC
jgi:hypothetical protein